MNKESLIQRCNILEQQQAELVQQINSNAARGGELNRSLHANLGALAEIKNIIQQSNEAELPEDSDSALLLSCKS